MLLLLTLALLAGPTCRAQNILDNKIGTYFYIRGEDQGELKGIRVFSSFYGFVGVQLLFGEQWSPVYGAQSSNQQKYLLSKGERVIAAGTNDGICVCYLHLVTSNGCKATLGTERDGFPLRVTRGSDKHALTIEGKYLSGTCITTLNFKWGHSPEGSIAKKPEDPMVSLCGAKEDAGGNDEDESNDRENAHNSNDKGSNDNGEGSKGACKDDSVDKGN
ncbi:prostatic spermine-binding protein-like [Chionomys nivalis]|uniref:prostatic spermine-binding protein-like n=1 Tax=Chionomys nivalis TaxID=269649 RepID=UPI002594F843|nr:prostatic spermine-binding protein-like [Chionomys nivalis]